MRLLQNINKKIYIKATKKILIIPVILSILHPTIIISKMPSDHVIERNREADLIVIAEVYDKGAALLVKNPPEKTGKPPLSRFIVLKVVQVIKGDEKIKPNSLIHLLSRGDPEKQHNSNIAITECFSPIQAERGSLVIVYADNLPNNPGFYSNKTIIPFFPSNLFLGSL